MLKCIVQQQCSYKQQNRGNQKGMQQKHFPKFHTATFLKKSSFVTAPSSGHPYEKVQETQHSQKIPTKYTLIRHTFVAEYFFSYTFLFRDGNHQFNLVFVAKQRTSFCHCKYRQNKNICTNPVAPFTAERASFFLELCIEAQKTLPGHSGVTFPVLLIQHV